MNSSSVNGKDELLSEVRELKKAVALLEAKVAGQEEDVDDVWGIWPYCWVVSGWDRAAELSRATGRRMVAWRDSHLCHGKNHRFAGCPETGNRIITIKPV